MSSFSLKEGHATIGTICFTLSHTVVPRKKMHMLICRSHFSWLPRSASWIPRSASGKPLFVASRVQNPEATFHGCQPKILASTRSYFLKWLLGSLGWLGPAHVVMKEHKKDGEGQDRVHVYWLAYKTQLIKCAPHHVRADIKGSQHALDDVQSALTTVRQLKSRGVTRYCDLHQLNKSNLTSPTTRH